MSENPFWKTNAYIIHNTMTLVLSHRIDRLIDFLAERVDRSPFQESWILLPGLINKQWLSLELVKRVPEQAICGIRWFSWQQALASLSFIPDPFTLSCALIHSEWMQQFKRKNDLVWRMSRQIIEAELYEMDLFDLAIQQNSLFSEKGLLGRSESSGKDLFSLKKKEGVYFENIPLQEQNAQIAQIHCFCTEELPRAAWDFLARLTKDFSVYLFSPCRMFWEDLCTDRQRNWLFSQSQSKELDELVRDTHPLLANWGVLAREALKSINQMNFEVLENYEEFPGDSLLKTIQRDLLNLRSVGEGITPKALDASFRCIAAGASKLSEVQILKEHIVRLVAQGVSYSEILVLAPDIRSYARLIQFVFGEEIPLRIPSLPKASPGCEGLLLLFSLIEENWTADVLLELLENQSVQEKQNLTNEDLKWMRRWMQEAQIREGWEGANGCLQGIQRLYFGLIYLLPEELGPKRISSIDWGEAERLQRFIDLLQLLKKNIDVLLEEQECSLRSWAEKLKRVMQDLFRTDEELWRSFLQKLISTESQELFSLSFLHSALKEHLRSAQETVGALWVDAIQCCSLTSGAIRPAYAVFLLGCSSEQFPLVEEHSSLDWKSEAPDRALRDRSLLLQTLFAAQEEWNVSYCHLSAEDGQPVEPALPIQELLDVLERYYDLKTVIHTVQMPKKETDPIPLPWPKQEIKNRAPNLQKEWHLNELHLLARNPWRYYLQKTLGIFPKKREKLFSEISLEEYLPSYREEQQILKQALHNEFDCDDWSSKGAFGLWSEVQIQTKIASWRTHFLSWGIEPKNVKTLYFEGDLTGTVDLAMPGALFVTTDLSLLSLLRVWPSLLAVASLTEHPPAIYSLKTGAQRIFDSFERTKWDEYVVRAQESPSPLILPWADSFLRKEKEVWKEDAVRVLQTEKDEAIRWMSTQYAPFPLDQIWEEWHSFLQGVFDAFL